MDICWRFRKYCAWNQNKRSILLYTSYFINSGIIERSIPFHYLHNCYSILWTRNSMPNKNAGFMIMFSSIFYIFMKAEPKGLNLICLLFIGHLSKLSVFLLGIFTESVVLGISLVFLWMRAWYNIFHFFLANKDTLFLWSGTLLLIILYFLSKKSFKIISLSKEH